MFGHVPALLAPLLFVVGFAAGRSPILPRPRRGGWGRPGASSDTNRRTAERAPIYSSSSALHGLALAERVTPLARREASKLIARGFSTPVSTDGGTTGPTPRGNAATYDYCRCGAHVLGEPCYFPPDGDHTQDDNAAAG